MALRRERYLITILLTTMIFFTGIFIGTRITSSKLADIESRLEQDFLETQSLELELTLAQESSLCSYISYRLPSIVKTKVDLGRKFDIGDIPEEQATLLEKQYIISLVKYWLFNNLQEERCGIKNPRILFFFTNSELSREQGKVLDYLVFRSNETLNVFSFNLGHEEPLIRLIAERYNITDTPTLVIGNATYQGFRSAQDISAALCARYNMTFC